uniref:Uncharacterized protein n=1 Tax=Glossina austeni TaxID=7395 RepID=A0A1A9VU58_GLOAU
MYEKTKSYHIHGNCERNELTSRILELNLMGWVHNSSRDSDSSSSSSSSSSSTQHCLQTYPSHTVDDNSANQSEDNIKLPAMTTCHVHTRKRNVPPPDLQPAYQYCGVLCEHLKRVGNDMYCFKFHIFFVAENPEATFRVYAYARVVVKPAEAIYELSRPSLQLNMDADLINPTSNYKDSKWQENNKRLLA